MNNRAVRNTDETLYMKKLLPFLFLNLISFILFAQQMNISGKVIDSASRLPVNGVTIALSPGKRTDITDESGRFFFKDVSGSFKLITVSGVGYQKKMILMDGFKSGQMIVLSAKQTQLSDVNITANSTNPYKTISESDIKMRNVSNSQEVLRVVPGLFIGQHQGGGKAEQIFLRGFDNDHGTDISLNVDGMPINMVSHAHGQGYADSHFIIPETIEGTTYKKGPYDAEKGDCDHRFCGFSYREFHR